jgi:hypothetical protein
VRNHTVAQLRRQGKRLERLNVTVTATLAAMCRGEALHLHFGRYGPVWRLTSGRTVPAEVAQIVAKNPNVAGVGDALFNDIPAQTWRYVEI